MEHSHDHTHHASMPPEGSAIDPVCSMTVKIEGAKHIATHNNEGTIFAVPDAKPSFRATLLNISTPVKRRRSQWWQEPFIPARCTRKFSRSAPAPAPFAAWRGANGGDG